MKGMKIMKRAVVFAAALAVGANAFGATSGGMRSDLYVFSGNAPASTGHAGETAEFYLYGGDIYFKDATKSTGQRLALLGGAVDHGETTGLADDDHSQYYNAARLAAYVGNATNVNAFAISGDRDSNATLGAHVADADIHLKLADIPAASGADPTTVVNGTSALGSATTYMRSDAAPALANPFTVDGAPQVWLGDMAIEGASDTAAAILYLYSDLATDNSDKWRIQAADGGALTWASYASGSYVTGLTLSNAGALAATAGVSGTTLTSTVATGTAPLTVASTTAVTNLNADLLDGESAAAFQDVDTGLTALSSIGTGIIASTASDTFAARTITGTANQITVSNGGGIAGNPTLALADPITPTDGTQNITGALTTSGAISGTALTASAGNSTVSGKYTFSTGQLATDPPTYSYNDKGIIQWGYVDNYPTTGSYDRVLDIVSPSSTQQSAIRFFTQTTNSTNPQLTLLLDNAGNTIATGDVTVTGNDIKSSTATALTLSGANVTVAGDATITGNDIKDSGGAAALTFDGSQGATFAKQLKVTGNASADYDLQVCSTYSTGPALRLMKTDSANPYGEIDFHGYNGGKTYGAAIVNDSTGLHLQVDPDTDTNDELANALSVAPATAVVSINQGLSLDNEKKFTRGSYIVSKSGLDYNDTSAVTICTVAAGEVVRDIYVEPTTVWDGNGYIKIGDNDDADGYLSTQQAPCIDMTSSAVQGGIAHLYTISTIEGYLSEVYSDIGLMETHYTKKSKAYSASNSILFTAVQGTSSQGSCTVYVVIDKLK